jgi:hypothetical protein
MQETHPLLYAVVLTVRASWDKKQLPIYPDIRNKSRWTLLEEAVHFVFGEKRCVKRKKISLQVVCRKGKSKRCMPACDGGW